MSAGRIAGIAKQNRGQGTFRVYLKEFSRSKSGMAGLILLLILVMISAYVLVAFPANIASSWNNPKQWQANPPSSPPAWLGYFSSAYPPTITFGNLNWNQVKSSSPSIYNYSNSYDFQWSSPKTPTNVLFIPQLNTSVLEFAITWIKPDGTTLVMYVANPTNGYQYSVADPTLTSWIKQFVAKETGTSQSTLSLQQEMNALFNKDGSSLMSNPVLQGTYHVRIDILNSRPTLISSNTVFSVNGNSYGAMGTDLYGRPIELGILLGLPWALELGGLTAVIAVVFGVIFGGISGYIGGKRDSVMQWVSLVALALPALPFLIALSYSIRLDLVSEALLIAALSWPFYAIIARSVALSVKSQTYVEADRAIGVSAIRTFFTHFMPRLTPVSIAYTALGVPAGILLAQTLAFLGIQPATIVTWGGLLDDAFVQQAALFGWWWWVLFPGISIVVAAVPFVLVGFALDKIVAPKVNAK